MKIPTAIKSIRAKCLDCSCDSFIEVKECPCKDCALYPYRLGKNPNRVSKGGMSAEHMKKIRMKREESK